MKAIFSNVLAELTGETEMRHKFLKLKTKAQVVFDAAEELPESAKIAAIDMISKFTDLLNKDKKNEDKRSPSYQNEMVREARKIIAYYETDLEVDVLDKKLFYSLFNDPNCISSVF